MESEVADQVAAADLKKTLIQGQGEVDVVHRNFIQGRRLAEANHESVLENPRLTLTIAEKAYE